MNTLPLDAWSDLEYQWHLVKQQETKYLQGQQNTRPQIILVFCLFFDRHPA